MTFTPTDTTDYTSATADDHDQRGPGHADDQPGPTPHGITYGTALWAAAARRHRPAWRARLTYYAGAGTVPAGAATARRSRVTFTPTDTTDYTTATRHGHDRREPGHADDHLGQPGGHHLRHGLCAARSSTPRPACRGPSPTRRPRARSCTRATARRSRSPSRPPTRPTTPPPPPTATINVKQATPTITWANPGGITYGTALRPTQLDATGQRAGHLHLHAGRRHGPARRQRPDALGHLHAHRHDRLHHRHRHGDHQRGAGHADDHLGQPGGHHLRHGAGRPPSSTPPPACPAPSPTRRPPARSCTRATTRRSRSPSRPPTRPTTPPPPPRRRSASRRPRRRSPGPTRRASSTARPLGVHPARRHRQRARHLHLLPGRGHGPARRATARRSRSPSRPTDTTDYTTATTTATINVAQATPTITWANPAASSTARALCGRPARRHRQRARHLHLLAGRRDGPARGQRPDALGHLHAHRHDRLHHRHRQHDPQRQPGHADDHLGQPGEHHLRHGALRRPSSTPPPACPAPSPTPRPPAPCSAAGNGQTLSVTFTPTDTTDYTTAGHHGDHQRRAGRAGDHLGRPGGITYGTALSSAQLDATASVPGTFAYSPAAGTVLARGQRPDALGRPSRPPTRPTTPPPPPRRPSASPRPRRRSPGPPRRASSTARRCSSTQLDATASVPGTFTYSPAAGTVPSTGNDTLSVTFAPTDTTDYQSATASTTISVTTQTPTLTSINFGATVSLSRWR